jgi:signal transduction histidine kinase
MSWWPRSLTLRILVVEILAISAAIVILPLAAVSLLHDAIDIEQQGMLTDQAKRIARELDVRGLQAEVHLTPFLENIYANGYDGRAYQIIDDKGMVRAKSPGATAIPTVHIPRSVGITLFHVHPYVAVSKPITADGRRLWIVVSQNETGPGAIVDDVARRFLWQYSLALMGVLALLPIINALSIRRLVLVVRQVSEQASKIGPNTPGERLYEGNLPAEVTELVRATNRLVDRLEFSLSQQRYFVANLTHELKTPLATLKIQLDGLADPSLKREIGSTVERLSHVVSQMRDLAELETLDQTARQPFDLGDVARQMVEELAPFVYEAGHQIELRPASETSIVHGSRLLIELALRNLIFNAVQHTAAGTHIVVDLSNANILAVSDDGPGLQADQKASISKRFWRADQTRSDTAGLGLSIVERICHVHGATLTVQSEPGLGAKFSINFAQD